jgi:gamma-glutamylcyclotransferase (GGCT)/AIG2-like uncharacterized protein YtfP
MNNPIHNLFVYGSLRSGFHNPAYQYLSQYFNLIGEGIVKGKLFDKGEYPVAILTSEEKFITGELYTINSAAEFSYAIGQIDDYEGVLAEAGETPLYKREAVTVLQNNQQHTAWIYWFNGTIDGLAAIASGDVLKYMQEKNKL